MMPGLEREPRDSRDRGRAHLGDLRRTGVCGTRAWGCPDTKAGVGEGKENEEQWGQSTCHLIWKDCNAGTGDGIAGERRCKPTVLLP